MNTSPINRNKLLYYPLVVFFLFSMSCYLVVAYTEYQNAGANSYDLGNGKFGSEISITNYIQNIANPKQMPLVADLNNNGIMDIIALDGNTIKIYSPNNFVPISSYDLPIGNKSNIYIYDILADGLKKIIISNQPIAGRRDIYILNFSNSNNLQLGYYINISTATQADGTVGDSEAMIGCIEPHKCIITFITSSIPSTYNSVDAVAFNETSYIANSTILHSFTDISTNIECYSSIRAPVISDFNSDGKNEMIFTFAANQGSNSDLVYIEYAGINSNGNVTDVYSISHAITPPAIARCEAATGKLGDYFTPPLIDDFVVGGNLETVIGEMDSSTTFRMNLFSSTGSETDYPYITSADGIIISNAIKMDAFPVAKGANRETDFCVMGFRSSTQTLDLLCGSAQYSRTLSNFEYRYNYSGFNVSAPYMHYTNIIHAVKESNANPDGYDMDEILTPYGILQLAASSNDNWDLIHQCTLLNYCSLRKIWTSPTQEAAYISVDAQKTGYEDLIALTRNNIYYIDDRFTNSIPILCANTNDCSISPCVERAWQLNTTVQINLKASDVDVSDLLSFRAIAYYNTIFQFSTEWSANVSSSTTMILQFPANNTISSGIIRLQVMDSAEHLISKDVPFSVSNIGAITGDCNSYLTPSTTGNISLIGNPTGQLPIDLQNNAVAQGVGFFNELFHLGVFGTYLMLIIALDLWIVFDKRNTFFQGNNHKYTITIIALVDLLLIVLGAVTGIIPFGAIITLVIIGILVVAFYVMKIFSGGNQTG